LETKLHYRNYGKLSFSSLVVDAYYCRRYPQTCE